MMYHVVLRMGVFSVAWMLAAVPAGAQCLGDADNNGFINFADYTAVRTKFGTSCVNQPYCGNGIVEPGEECDQSNVGDQSCDSLGYWEGTLSCAANCQLNTSECSHRYIDQGNGTILDIHSGLMWEKKSDDGSIHDKDSIHSWGSATPPHAPNGTAFFNHLAALNGAADGSCFAGYCDWRLPSRSDYDEIIDVGELAPKLPEIFKAPCSPGCSVTECSCAIADGYWTTTTVPDSPSEAWFAYLNNGGFFEFAKQNLLYVRAVRGGKTHATGRFVDNHDGTISDMNTGLTWAKKSDDGSIHDKDNLYNWGSETAPYTPSGTAFTDYIATLNGAGTGVCFADHCDWRLPAKEELEALVVPGEPSPRIDPIFKTPCTPGCAVHECSCTRAGDHATGTTVPGFPFIIYGVSFDTGHTSFPTKQVDLLSARAVRGGP